MQPHLVADGLLDHSGRAGGLPASWQTYAQSPAATLRKLAEWVNARWYLRTCTRVGAWPRVTGRPYVQNDGELEIGQFVRVYAHFARSVLAVFPGGRLTIGDRTVLNYGVDIAATQLVQIGADCMLGTHVTILDSDFHELEQRDRAPAPRPVIIGDGVWIGNRAIILPGVTIGDGAAVGAGSVVVSDVPARTLAMGNPARVFKKF